ncbi:hypothetical protein BH09BAC4_BH09BAC4_19000 [soil metagenome]
MSIESLKVQTQYRAVSEFCSEFNAVLMKFYSISRYVLYENSTKFCDNRRVVVLYTF